MGGGRAPCCDKSKVRSGPWSLEEDSKIINFIQIHGHGNWRALPKQAGLLRCGKSCRLRWINYLRADVKRGNFTPEEEQTIINLHNSIGNKWSKIASCLPGRTDNEIKNVWNTRLKKRIIKTESKESKKSYSASKSCTPSSITSTSGGDDKLLKVISTHPNDPKESKQTTTSDSVASSHALNEALGFSTSVANNEEGGCTLDDGIIEIPSEFDIDFWELSDSLDPLQSTEVELISKCHG